MRRSPAAQPMTLINVCFRHPWPTGFDPIPTFVVAVPERLVSEWSGRTMTGVAYFSSA